MKTHFVRLAFILFPFSLSSGGNPVTGHWIHKNFKGEITEKIEFRKDGTFEAFLPAENYRVGGKYKLEKNSLMISDTGCNAKYWGKYEIVYQGKDSITPTSIDDTCIGRKMSADKMLFVRE